MCWPSPAQPTLLMMALSRDAVRDFTTALSMSAEEGHKYIIVGGGTAGCVLANRLSAEKVGHCHPFLACTLIFHVSCSLIKIRVSRVDLAHESKKREESTTAGSTPRAQSTPQTPATCKNVLDETSFSLLSNEGNCCRQHVEMFRHWKLETWSCAWALHPRLWARACIYIAMNV